MYCRVAYNSLLTSSKLLSEIILHGRNIVSMITIAINAFLILSMSNDRSAMRESKTEHLLPDVVVGGISVVVIGGLVDGVGGVGDSDTEKYKYVTYMRSVLVQTSQFRWRQ